MQDLTFISLGGIGDVTKNMYAYIFGNEILLVDCGIGFADAELPGVDLLIPDISYLKELTKNGKKIVGMALSHGHEDHIGALPFILPQLPQFPIFGSTLTAALSNEKLKEFGINNKVKVIKYAENITLGAFTIQFIRMTHSILDATNIFIKTPVGNFYHGSDYKFDFTPVDGNPSDLSSISKAGDTGVLCLLSDCLGSERPGHSESELDITKSFEEAFRHTKGKIFVTTYSSNISRLNQAIEVGLSMGRKVCLMGRSLLKARDIGRQLGYMNLPKGAEVRPGEVARMDPSKVLFLVAGSQAQEFSALTRVANNDDRDITIQKGDLVIFSSDPIPGNEQNINSLIDTISMRGARVMYSEITPDFHVSGHGSQDDLKLMISLTRPKYLLPIGGTYRQMIAYRGIAESMGYKDNEIFLPSAAQEVIFGKLGVRLGKKVPSASVFLDRVTREEIDDYVVVDRMRISKEGLIILLVEINTANGQLADKIDVLTKGFVYDKKDEFAQKLGTALSKRFMNKNEKITSVGYYKKLIEKTAEEMLYKEGRSPLVVPVILEV